eukprot:Phypoly_transcript_20787.p1 GENE.Phypoly_transcript_20787~~Phypoly_transcript_20787.p1  ORF type:complete len:199 (+),score=59.19 Phypoly_transcript_20787:33-599(+)
MELQELLNTTAAALVDASRKHEEAHAGLGAREREVESLKWQLAALQKRAEESFAVQEKMRAFIKDQEASLEGSKRRVVAETEHIFREMRAELERNQFTLKMETRRRDAFARAVAGALGVPQTDALLRQSGIQPEGIGGAGGLGGIGGVGGGIGGERERERGHTENFGSLRREDLWSSQHSSSGHYKFS